MRTTRSRPLPPPPGEYGPHGREIIRILPPTDEYPLVAVKVTGDINVPSGEITFRIFAGEPERRDDPPLLRHAVPRDDERARR